MRKITQTVAIFALLILALTLLAGCTDKRDGDGAVLDYSRVELDSCIKLGEYKGLRIELEGANSSKSEAVWKIAVDSAVVLDYPAAAVEYYVEQTELRYKHYAEEGSIEYSELLESLGISEADIESEAKRYVKEDLVQLAILKAEGIELTDAEKERLLDRYVKKYVEDYGYTEDYVRNNLKEEIYKSMLFDKMLEYLMLNNTFIVKE